MTCPNERIVGAIFVVLSGSAFAGGPVFDSPQPMIVANIVAVPAEVVPRIPEPKRYFQQQRYAMEYQSNHDKPFYAQIENFYSADVTHDVRLSESKPLVSSTVQFLPVSGAGFDPAFEAGMAPGSAGEAGSVSGADGDGGAASGTVSGPVSKQASTAVHFTSGTGPQISIVQMNSSTLSIGASPQRRLSLTVDDWVFTGTARVALLRSHDTGATLIVKKKY
ncbi:hypothetical protein LJ656_26380 [Paraburkholderia sp. MMS20-SJTR3]|uniref:Uncharacterized protein n=1 Tax=Paraburkholderia sejongensis TaxID=2886946 RepID=A0ABS8K1U9_9BURK|nr:hypothetical protein [Paraburkholderia sp. MMS20-SJTR3]MCC8396121.1 hypothetical protein [Paraburkholderia sp. MMS20-SJTR3]